MGDISILSNATLQSMQSSKVFGNLTVDYDAGLENNSVHISVSMQTSTRALQTSTLVCYTDIGPNRGLSIFVRLRENPIYPADFVQLPNNMTQIETISMDVHVVFPPALSPSITIPNFNVYLPLFTQTFQDLKAVNFDSVNIEGSIRPIDVMVCFASARTPSIVLTPVQGIQAPRISVKNMLADISGTFNASESLCIDTIKG